MLTPDDTADLNLSDMELFTETCLGDIAISVQSTNLSYFNGGEHGTAVRCALAALTILFSVPGIVGVTAPIKIVGAIVGLTVIFMTGIGLISGRLTVESDCDHAVDERAIGFAFRIERDKKVAPRGGNGLKKLGLIF